MIKKNQMHNYHENTRNNLMEMNSTDRILCVDHTFHRINQLQQQLIFEISKMNDIGIYPIIVTNSSNLHESLKIDSCNEIKVNSDDLNGCEVQIISRVVLYKSKGMNSQIFISYVKEDFEKVYELYNYLKNKGLNIWMDRDIQGGDKWQNEIYKVIQNSRLFIVCISSTSVKKRGYFQKEINYALDKAKEFLPQDTFIIPVRFDDTELPTNLSDFQYVNLYNDNDLRKLHDLIVRIINS